MRTPTCMPWLDACHLHYLFVGVTNLFCCKGHCVHESQSARSNLQKGSSFISRCPTYVGHECSAEGLADGCPSVVLFGVSKTSTRLLTLSTRPSALSFTLDRVITLVALLPLLILRLKKCPQLEKLRCKPLS